MKHRLAIVTSHVIQHQDPRFRRLAEHPAIGLTVLCCSAIGAEWYLDWDLGLEQQWDLEMLHGYRHRCLRSFALRARFARTSGFLLTRTTHGDFCRHFGADPSRFFPMPYAIDNDRFFRASRLRPEERSALRAELGVSADLMVLLFSGKLMVRKRPLIQAYERMINRDSAAVVFMGDGAEPAMLESYVKSRGLEGVHLLGFVNQTRVPQAYGASDILALPSTYDPRGTVVNEAMACDLPIVISNMVGLWGDGDIVREGENGFVVPVDDIDRLAGVLDALASDSDLRARMVARSLEIISTWNYHRDVEGVLTALRATVPRPARSELVPSHQAG